MDAIYARELQIACETYRRANEMGEMNEKRKTHPTAHCTNSSLSEKRNKYQSVFLWFPSRLKIATAYTQCRQERAKIVCSGTQTIEHTLCLYVTINCRLRRREHARTNIRCDDKINVRISRRCHLEKVCRTHTISQRKPVPEPVPLTSRSQNTLQ